MTDSQSDIGSSIGSRSFFGLSGVDETRAGVTFRRQSYHRRSAFFNANPNNDNGGDANTNNANAGCDTHRETTAGRGFEDAIADSNEKILLPQSTHSLLFTEDVFSLPFGFALFVLMVSNWCLALSLWDNLSGGIPGNPLNVPVNVAHQVRVAQHLSVLIALWMEEEIPTATYLLRMIPRSSVEKMGLSYEKFVFSAIARLLVGSVFLLNVFLAVIQSDRVLDMFYDMLALNFVAMVDDITFHLAKYDVLGKRLRDAASAKYFHVEFEKRPYLFRKKMTLFVKFVYIFNLLLSYAGLTAIGIMQRAGTFQCKSVTVTFGQDIWENAWVETSPGRTENMVLVYSYFNGVYKQIDGETKSGRPVYKEMKKSTDTPFDSKTGAEISYCGQEGAWVLTHEHIRKSREPEDSDCPWLVRSPDTRAFDLLDVSDRWNIWVGTINDDALMKIACNGCKTDTDCNLNGKCGDDGKCHCSRDDEHYGMHCELEKPCRHIRNDRNDNTWSMIYESNCKPLIEYGRPVYALTSYHDALKEEFKNEVTTIEDDDILALIFTGSRWFVMQFSAAKRLDQDYMERRGNEFHAFWDRAFDNGTLAVSDFTTRSHPVGVDTFRVGERGPQYGPLGVLYPLQEPPGKGSFRCVDIVTAESAGFINLFNSSCDSSDMVNMGQYRWET